MTSISALHRDLISKLLSYSTKKFKPTDFNKAWNEFFGTEDEIFDEGHPLVSIMMPWFLFSWTSRRFVNPALSFFREKMSTLSKDEKDLLH